jgi:hypothetical protein
MGQLEQAETHGKKSIELNPDYWGGPILLTRIYLLQGRPQDALREIERVHYAPYRAHLYALTYLRAWPEAGVGCRIAGIDDEIPCK